MSSIDYYAPDTAAKNTKTAGTLAVAALSLALANIAVCNTLPSMLFCGIIGLASGIITIVLSSLALKKGACGGKRVMAGFGLALGILAIIGGLVNTCIALFIGEQALLDYLNDLITKLDEFAGSANY